MVYRNSLDGVCRMVLYTRALSFHGKWGQAGRQAALGSEAAEAKAHTGLSHRPYPPYLAQVLYYHLENSFSL